MERNKVERLRWEKIGKFQSIISHRIIEDIIVSWQGGVCQGRFLWGDDIWFNNWGKKKAARKNMETDLIGN